MNPNMVHSEASKLTPASDTSPRHVVVSCPAPEQVRIKYGPNARREAMTDEALSALRQICSNACIRSVTITSTARAVEDQARIMYGNIRRQGAAAVRSLYRAPGQAVVSAYEEGARAGLDEHGIRAAMAARIREVGPENVSRHIAQDGICVFDVAPSSIPAGARARFVAAVQAHNAVRHFLQPPRDPAYHLEI
ncbi:hypothetical protein E5843_00720 [Luteimonas yindakuii]|uniref:hypothetical protein n=1 Tax=Luteimonas yindakuii TaxID=2565782 RepID=UPI0010A4256E|nr:hypothetical protein [Luteimonas yindakuii]QCO66682.1 hypothetical protein E5843_00720 [Luteimonas yindakuii]